MRTIPESGKPITYPLLKQVGTEIHLITQSVHIIIVSSNPDNIGAWVAENTVDALDIPEVRLIGDSSTDYPYLATLIDEKDSPVYLVYSEGVRVMHNGDPKKIGKGVTACEYELKPFLGTLTIRAGHGIT